MDRAYDSYRRNEENLVSVQVRREEMKTGKSEG
jgi:hypothetical protein